MNKGLLWLVAGVVVVVVLGMVALRASAPAEETPIEVEELETLDNQPGSGQFIQEIPEVSLPTAGPTQIPASSPVGETAATVITMDENGFSPQTVTVAAGTTVTFINNGQAPHWPASDVHPTHEVLPEFDSKRGLATGESYSFTFTESGTWSCHDHLMPNNTCTIIAE